MAIKQINQINLHTSSNIIFLFISFLSLYFRNKGHVCFSDAYKVFYIFFFSLPHYPYHQPLTSYGLQWALYHTKTFINLIFYWRIHSSGQSVFHGDFLTTVFAQHLMMCIRCVGATHFLPSSIIRFSWIIGKSKMNYCLGKENIKGKGV